ncbi:RadC family protein [Roseicyclus persicicus]|uniref:DNA repair protein RadC n=1 Tax=Roseicyclus persicicus TaxID=2650661 RepID=A0A7X6GVX3_9RHOB|nr:DNA repair protein RadC [Roseibacterium persicicum]NKX43386.1 DNA repair protein RadC [Roseibacterium persicicum]
MSDHDRPSRGADRRGGGFSEEALRRLDELEARLPPPDAVTAPAFRQGFRMTPRLAADVAAGGGLITDAAGNIRPHYWGHRERLRTRFLQGGHKPMPEYEILELLLFNAIPKVDVKPLAKRLLAAFGDLNGVVAASEHRLLQVEGATPKVYLQLRIVEAFAHRMAQARVLHREVVSSWDALIAYCRTAMAHRDTEQVRVLYLDRKNKLIADEEQGQGTVDHVPVYPREIARRCLELNASALILVHNHPSGDPTPSRSDIDMTARIVEACRALDVTVHDHVIIGKDRELSFRSEGLI